MNGTQNPNEATTTRYARYFLAAPFLNTCFLCAILLFTVGTVLAQAPTPAKPTAPTGCAPLPAGKTLAYSYSHPLAPGKCVMFVEKDPMLYYSAGKGKVVTLLRPKKAKLDSMITLLRKYRKIKLGAEDILLIQTAIPVWDSVQMNIGFTELPSGLAYKVTKEGTGKEPEKGKRVKVHYRGYFQDGKEFDNSFRRGQPIEIVLGAGQVIKGWDEGIGLFKIGGQGTLRIPSAMGYGDRGIPGVIPEKATLYFDIEVVSAD